MQSLIAKELTTYFEEEEARRHLEAAFNELRSFAKVAHFYFFQRGSFVVRESGVVFLRPLYVAYIKRFGKDCFGFKGSKRAPLISIHGKDYKLCEIHALKFVIESGEYLRITKNFKRLQAEEETVAREKRQKYNEKNPKHKRVRQSGPVAVYTVDSSMREAYEDDEELLEP